MRSFRSTIGTIRSLAWRTAMVLALAAGCAHYTPQPISPEETAAATRARSLADPGLQQFAEANLPELSLWPPGVWDLEHLVLAAFYFHDDLKLARARWGVAQAGQVTAGQRPNPSLVVSPAYNVTSAIASPWLVTASIEVPIETAGKRGYRQAQAARAAQAGALGVLAEAWRVRAEVRRSFVEFVAARESVSLSRRQAELEAEAASLLESQWQVGAVPAFEVTRARIASANAQLSLGDALRDAALARVALAGSVGVPARALDGLEISSEGLDEQLDDASIERAQRQALLERTDIRVALAEYAASEAALQLEIARQFPDLKFAPGYEFDQGDTKWSLGLSVELPLLNQNQGPIAEAEARRAESAARFEALQTRVLAAIEASAAGYRAARQQLQDADALHAELQRQQEIDQVRFDAGVISRSEWVGLLLRQSASERARLDAIARLYRARGDLDDALQDPEILRAPPADWLTRPIASNAEVN